MENQYVGGVWELNYQKNSISKTLLGKAYPFAR